MYNNYCTIIYILWFFKNHEINYNKFHLNTDVQNFWYKYSLLHTAILVSRISTLPLFSFAHRNTGDPRRNKVSGSRRVKSGEKPKIGKRESREERLEPIIDPPSTSYFDRVNRISLSSLVPSNFCFHRQLQNVTYTGVQVSLTYTVTRPSKYWLS